MVRWFILYALCVLIVFGYFVVNAMRTREPVDCALALSWVVIGGYDIHHSYRTEKTRRENRNQISRWRRNVQEGRNYNEDL